MKQLARTLSLSLSFVAVAALAPMASAQVQANAAEKAAKTVYQQKALIWHPQIAYRSASLRITGPQGFAHDREFGNLTPVFDLTALPDLADGQYKFEIVFGKEPDAGLAKALSSVQPGEDGATGDPAMSAKLRSLREVVSGSFRVEGGLIVSPDLVEPRVAQTMARGKDFGAAISKDQVISDDLIVDGSACIGFDCVNGESFGFDTIRLKENNLRIKFDDTSATASFPKRDWQLTANDSANGGLEKFSIDDVTSGRTPFTIEGDAPSNSLYVDDGGQVGFGTSTPVVTMHARNGNTPTLRLEQDGSSGFTAQTWDVASNEVNFFIRDVTNGSRLPFRIRPGAPTSSIDVSAAGDIGFGTTSTNIFGGAAKAVTIKSGSGFPVLELQGAQTADSATGAIRFYNGTTFNAQIASVREGANDSASLRFLTTNVGSIGERMRINPWGLVGIGTTAPTDTLHVVGSARVVGNLHVSGSIGPDYVFDPNFKLASIEENAAFMWKNRHLPALGPARTSEDGKGTINVYSHVNGMLEELEKAHIYIETLHKEIKSMKADLAELRKRVEK